MAMQRQRYVAVMTLFLLVAGRLSAAHDPVWGMHGAVASSEVHASAAGIEILEQGGNAVDAAVAVGFTLAVTHPYAGNLGGGGFMLIRQASGQSYFLDYREVAPAAATANMYLDAKGNYIPKSSILGYRAVGVPGSVAGLAAAQRRFGKLSLATVMAPAIRLAEQGFPLAYAQAQSLHAENLEAFPESRRLFQRDGQYYQPGETFRQPELAATLRRIARVGPQDFYRGEIAGKLAAFMAAHGGLITAADLADYQPKWRTPLTGTYRGYQVITAPPPSSGGVALLEMLNMLEPTDYQKAGFLSAASLQYEAEAMRRAFADRSRFLGDSDFVPVPVAQLTDKAFARSRWASFKSGVASASAAVGPGQPAGAEAMETTHFSVVDPAGDAVAVTTTLNGAFGSGVTVDGLGFLLNNEMDDFTSKPGVPNMFGLVQGKANAIQPHKRPLSSMTPTIVTRDGKLALVLGSPGGPTIINTVLEVLTGVVDFGLNIREAVEAPKIHHQWLPDVLRLDGFGFSPDTVAVLEHMGYQVKVGGFWCDSEDIAVDPKTGARMAASDPRASGISLAY